MNNSAKNYDELIKKIDAFIRKYYLNQIVRGSICLVSVFFLGYILLVFAAYYGNLSPTIRTIFVFGLALSVVGILLYYIIFPTLSYFKLGKVISNEQASELIGAHFKDIKDRLLNTLQLKELLNKNPAHIALIEASINQRVAELRPIPFPSAIRLQENKRYLKFVWVPILLILFTFLLAPAILNEGTKQLVHYDQFFAKKAPFQFIILNPNLSAMQGDDLDLKVKLAGNEIPQELYVDDGGNLFKLEKENVTRFNYTFKNLQQTKKIRLVAGEFSSAVYVIDVKLKAVLSSFEIALEYPYYLARKNEVIANSGDLTVPVGTQVRWNIRAKHTSQISFKLDNRLISLHPSDDGRFSLSHRAMQNANYTICPVGSQGISHDSIAYQLKVIPDLSPSIEVTERVDSMNNKLFYFVGQVSDDHGFSKLNFTYKILPDGLGNDSKSVIKSIPIDKKVLQTNFFYAWNIGETGAKPGQQIEYYFEIFDNDGVLGPKSSRYASKIFKLPSEKEIDQKLEAGSESIKQKMELAARKAGEIEKEAKRINRDLINKKSLTFEEKKQVEQLLAKQKDLGNLVKDIQKENEQNLFEQKENKEIRQEILDKQKQIEHLFNNVLNEKTKELLTSIQKMLEQNNKNQTQENLSKMQMDNKSLQKELDRVLELYKQLELEQKLAETVDKLEYLSEKQEKLSNKSLDKNADQQDLKQKQEGISKAFDDIKKELSELNAKKGFENPEKEQQEIGQQQKQIAKDLENKNMKKAAEDQKKASSQLSQLSKKLKEMGDQSSMQENSLNAKALREILKHVLNSSFEQEHTMLAIRSKASNDPEYVTLTQKQKDIQDNLKMVEDSLYSLSRKVPQIESTVNKEIQSINLNVDKAITSLADRRTAEANRTQQYAMTSLNNLALMLSEVLDKLQKSNNNGSKGSGKGKGQSMSALSKLQEELNKNMQKARDQMQQQGQQQGGQGKGKSSMSEAFAKMAQQQEMIRQAMQDVAKEEGGKAGSGKLSDLLKQMEQTETDLVNKKIVQETINRQQDILSKLLEAEKAQREREQDVQRESKQGIDRAVNNQRILQEYQKFKQKETELLKTVPPTLNSFYKTKVEEYFKVLNSGS